MLRYAVHGIVEQKQELSLYLSLSLSSHILSQSSSVKSNEMEWRDILDNSYWLCVESYIRFFPTFCLLICTSNSHSKPTLHYTTLHRTRPYVVTISVTRKMKMNMSVYSIADTLQHTTVQHSTAQHTADLLPYVHTGYSAIPLSLAIYIYLFIHIYIVNFPSDFNLIRCDDMTW